MGIRGENLGKPRLRFSVLGLLLFFAYFFHSFFSVHRFRNTFNRENLELVCTTMRSVGTGHFLGGYLLFLVIGLTAVLPVPEAEAGTKDEAAAAEAKDNPEDWLNYIREDRFMHKRGQDPRNLFASIYGNYDRNLGKRAVSDPRQLFASIYDNYNQNVGKRGGPSDPRSLFASIYGNYDQNIGKRAKPADPRSLFASIYGNYDDNIGKRQGSPVYGSLQAFNDKRAGLGGKLDPRNLFRAIYG